MVSALIIYLGILVHHHFVLVVWWRESGAIHTVVAWFESRDGAENMIWWFCWVWNVTALELSHTQFRNKWTFKSCLSSRDTTNFKNNHDSFKIYYNSFNKYLNELFKRLLQVIYEQPRFCFDLVWSHQLHIARRWLTINVNFYLNFIGEESQKPRSCTFLNIPWYTKDLVFTMSLPLAIIEPYPLPEQRDFQVHCEQHSC